MNDFFANSADFDREVLRPLSHIDTSWELTWDANADRYVEEDTGFGAYVNQLIAELSKTVVQEKYHDNEDVLAEYVKAKLNWNITKVGGRWQGQDYASILEQGGFSDINESELVQAAAGRIAAARRFGQTHFDQMESGHQAMLAAVMAIIIYHRSTSSDAA